MSNLKALAFYFPKNVEVVQQNKHVDEKLLKFIEG
jgi:hypothetical protein